MDKKIIGDFSLYQLLLYFFVYSFLGWCMEVIYATYRTNKFINRGFLNGPVCPIYGTGVVIVLLCLTPVKNNVFLLFICSIILTTLLELVTGFVLEKFFHTKWWDYTCQKWNFKGYICVKFSFIWGVICLIVVDILHVGINNLLMKIPYQVGLVLIIIFGTIIIIDLIITILQMAHLTKISKEVNMLSAAASVTSEAIGKTLSSATLTTIEKLELLKKKMENKRIVKAFPNLIKTITNKIDEMKESKKEERKEN